ncbi:MAG: S8 family serine peptidase [Candidatus Sulfotelmatobacter sp.]|jgi:subtilisin family serine protease
MKYCRWILPLILFASAATTASAQGIIVRDTLGLPGLNGTCLLLNCKVSANLGDPSGQLFLITVDSNTNLIVFLNSVLSHLGVVDAEIDQPLSLIEVTAGPVPESLLDQTPVPYFGAPVWDGYANQPAAAIVEVQRAQSSFNATGAGTVAMIDTGVDTQHPALVPVLVPGYNFINNTASGEETGSLNQSSAALLDGGGPTYLNGTTVAMVNQSTAALLDQPGNADFGHGTMTAGIVHLVAPTANIMPLVAFSPDGTGYLSNVIRATYYAVQHGSKVISMSFSFSSYSGEMANAITYANKKGVICVASAGNDGANVTVYPAGLEHVMGVASTSDYNTRSTFSNYGSDVWVAAPGEGIISTYPYGTYSAGWGTSFSAPFVSGAAALLVSISPSLNQQSAAAALAHAQYISSSGMGNGVLNVDAAMSSWLESTQNY